MKISFFSTLFLVGVLLSCDSNTVVEPAQIQTKKASARTIAPSNLSGWWKFQSWVQDSYPFPVSVNYSDYRTSCTTADRWIYFSPSTYAAYTYDGDQCYPGSASDINTSNHYLIEYFIWGNFSGETETYAFGSTGTDTGYLDLYRYGSRVVYSESTVFNSGNSLVIHPTFTGEYYYFRRATGNETPPSLP